MLLHWHCHIYRHQGCVISANWQQLHAPAWRCQRLEHRH
jgi:hypothetical protein